MIRILESGGRGRDVLLCGLLVLAGALAVVPRSVVLRHDDWNPDSLFYQAQAQEIRGEGRVQALNKVFAGKIAERMKKHEQGTPPSLRRVDNPRWVTYSARFYRRRWTVPLLAAALTPLAGTDSLSYVALIGMLLVAPFVYLLLRARFRRVTSFAAAATCLLLPPLLASANSPRTDSWGLVLTLAALIIALRVAERGPRWLPLWALVILVLSFTREDTLVVLSAVAWLALRQRSRLMLATTMTGIAATLPSLLVVSIPLRENLAYVINGYRVPVHSSWSSVISGYPGQLWSVIRSDFTYPVHAPLPPLAVAMSFVVVVGLVTLLASRQANDTLVTLVRGSVIGAVATILVSVNYTEMRIELVFVPAIAAGVALTVDMLRARSRADPIAAYARLEPVPAE